MSDYRTLGTTQNCKGCRYWSEMIAQSNGRGLEAMCLSDASERKGQYTVGTQTCGAWQSGHFGAIDEPGQHPNAYGNGTGRKS